MERNLFGHNFYLLVIFLAFACCKAQENNQSNQTNMLGTNTAYEIANCSVLKKVEGNKVSIFHVTGQEFALVFEMTFEGFRSAHVSKNGNYLFVHLLNEIVIYEINTTKKLKSIPGHFYKFIIEDDLKQLVSLDRVPSTASKGTITLWDIDTEIKKLDSITVDFYDQAFFLFSNDFQYVYYHTKEEIGNKAQSDLFKINTTSIAKKEDSVFDNPFQEDLFLHVDGAFMYNKKNEIFKKYENQDTQSIKLSNNPFFFQYHHLQQALYCFNIQKFSGDFDENAIFKIEKIDVDTLKLEEYWSGEIQQYAKKFIQIDRNGALIVLPLP
jgi:hypothetical protein